VRNINDSCSDWLALVVSSLGDSSVVLEGLLEFTIALGWWLDWISLVRLWIWSCRSWSWLWIVCRVRFWRLLGTFWLLSVRTSVRWRVMRRVEVRSMLSVVLGKRKRSQVRDRGISKPWELRTGSGPRESKLTGALFLQHSQSFEWGFPHWFLSPPSHFFGWWPFTGPHSEPEYHPG